MIHVNVSNNIILTGLPEATKKALKQSLTIENKDYWKFKKMGIFAPLDFKYYVDPKGFLPEHGALEMSRGCLTRLLAYLEKSSVKYEIVYNLVDKPAKLGISTLTLRDYQVPIVEPIVAMKASEGLLVSSTGSGKTLMALEIAHRLGLSTTFLVINSVIADQFVSEAKRFYGIDAARIDGKHKEVSDLTVATFQSLYDNDELLKKLSDNTSLLIVDEAQGVVSKERAKVLSSFRAKHMLGLTATPSREGSLTPAIFFLLGHPLVEHQMEQAQPVIEVIRTGAQIPMSDRYDEVITAMVENESRNKLIAGLVVGNALEGKKTLVLTKRRNHYALLRDRFIPNVSDGFIYIDSDDKGRNDVLAELKRSAKRFTCIFGTTSLLSVGTDIPSLDTLILACDMKSSVLTQQSVGRILRLFDGKPTPRIIDLYDDKNPVLASQFKSRLDLYKQKGWEISHYFKCPKCKEAFTWYRREYLIHNARCYGRK